MYLFGKITVKPQLPERISELSNLATNLWWSWNSYSLRLYDYIDSNLFEKVNKNPVKFLSLINQERLAEVAKDEEFLKDYDMVIDNFKNYHLFNPPKASIRVVCFYYFFIFTYFVQLLHNYIFTEIISIMYFKSNISECEFLEKKV